MKLFLFIIPLLASLASAAAGTINFKDGTSIEGEIISETEESVKIRQDAGPNGFIETYYPKKDLRQAGEETPAEAEQTNKSEQKPAEVSKEDVLYKSFLEDIAKELNSLKSMWDAGYFSNSSFKDWQNKFMPKEEEFKQKFSAYKKVSFSFMNLAFEQLNDFLSSLEDIERTKKKLSDSSSNQSPSDIKTKLEALLNEHKEFADKSLLQAIRYNSIAVEKATPSSE